MSDWERHTFFKLLETKCCNGHLRHVFIIPQVKNLLSILFQQFKIITVLRFLDEVKNRIGLAEVVGRRVRLVKKGREHTGLCPFHNEKTPSFTVNEDKGFYH